MRLPDAVTDMHPSNHNPTRLLAWGLALLLAVTALPNVAADDTTDLLPELPSLGGPEPLTGTDTTAPTVSSVVVYSHSSSSLWYNQDDVKFRAYASDESGGSGIDGLSYVIVPQTSTTQPDCTIDYFTHSGSGWRYITELDELPNTMGGYVVRVRAIDIAGNCGSVRGDSFNVDTIDPEITLQDPKPDEVVDATKWDVTIEYNDRDNGGDPLESSTSVDVNSIRFFIDGVDRTAEAVITKNVLTYTSPLGFTVGDHVIEFRMKDTSVGADEVVDSWTFRVNPASTTDEDGDFIPDSLEASICSQENKPRPEDGSCNDENTDYTPPSDLLGFIGDGVGEMSRFVNSLLGQLGKFGVMLHFN